MRQLALSLAMSALALLAASVALAQMEPTGETAYRLLSTQAHREQLQSSARRLRVSAGPDPDTVWFGHSYTDHWSATGNWWNLYVGVNSPGISNPANAIWDWDHTTGLSNHGIVDSLAGWWPLRRAYSQTGGLVLPDVSRPWWAIDLGNSINYVLNAGAGSKRTKGVVGLWHADPGSASGKGVTWSPLSGLKSAWCGIRELHDLSVIDQVTGNAFDASIHEFAGESGLTTSAKRFPGYVSQMDQLLYRDIAAPAATPLSISFLYRTRMSTSATTFASTRTGWFHGDPLAVVAGNFISSTDAGAATPVDSFSVYIGAPVNDAACKYSDGVTRPVYDPQRRWFSEVLRIFEGAGVPYYEIFSTAGSVPADTASATPTFSILVPAANVDAIRNAVGNSAGIVRLVFRVKTNRGFDDGESGNSGFPSFTSFSRGAALVDDVIVNGTNIGDFEGVEQGGANTIDNRAGTSALTNWKSTGKPPAIYFHLRNLADLAYNDLCGPPDSPARKCNISGTVMVAGNFDDNERHGDSRFQSDREVMHGFLSPTINLKTAGAGIPNEMGLTSSIVDVTDDYYIWYDVYAGMFNLQFTGNSWNYGCECYPNTQAGNLGKIWGSLTTPSTEIYSPEPRCFSDMEGLGFLRFTTNPGNVPDSLRVFIALYQSCFRFAVSLGCNSSDGGYYDNISVGFVDAPAGTQVSNANSITVGSISADIFQFINDAFPSNETAGLPGTAAFDTTGALLKGGLNIAQSTGNELRFDVPSDTIAIKASNVSGSTDPTFGNQTRLDMIFRILPGPGNYKNVGGRTFPPTPGMQLLRVPQNQANVVASGDGSFWGQFIADPGKFSAGTHHGGTYWDYLTWNSARCDTAEFNVFPIAGKITSGLTPGSYINTFSEQDPKFATLGTAKFRCFVVDTTIAATQTNIVCNGTVPTWLNTVPHSRTGWDGTTTTKEFTKIIPDGLLTPGAHVQYFFRKSPLADSSLFAMCPDTESVSPQNSEGSTDGHRWQQFGVLPDRWKDAAFGGAGMACMLYLDYCDRRGNEKVWVSVMDSLGGTAISKWGAHNGWHAAGGPQPAGYLGFGAGSNPAIAVVGKNQQPGTVWDMYGVKGSESLTTSANGIGGRYANRASMGLLTGHESRVAPTKEMLRQYYRILVILSGDLDSGILGPFANRGQNDIDVLNDYLTNPAGSAQPRALYVAGDGFVQGETASGGVDAAHTDFLVNKLGLSLRNGSYQSVSANVNSCADLVTANAITTNKDVYGIANSCAFSNDLLQRNPAITEATEASFYENVGPNGPYTASVYKPTRVTRPWIALTDGWEIEHTFGRYCDTNFGRLAYMYNMMNNVLGSICSLNPEPGITLGIPQNSRGPVINFMKIGNSVLRSGQAQVHFGVASADRIRIRLYDVSGRVMRTLADRSFAAGEYDLVWDGTDDGGHPAPRGVYFARIEYASKGAPITGRVVVLR